jgi:hypothetical protein
MAASPRFRALDLYALIAFVLFVVAIGLVYWWPVGDPETTRYGTEAYLATVAQVFGSLFIAVVLAIRQVGSSVFDFLTAGELPRGEGESFRRIVGAVGIVSMSIGVALLTGGVIVGDGIVLLSALLALSGDYASLDFLTLQVLKALLAANLAFVGLSFILGLLSRAIRDGASEPSTGSRSKRAHTSRTRPAQASTTPRPVPRRIRRRSLGRT